jgi:hypothetical protein
MMFHVYVEGPTDPSPDAHKRLAELMASRYGLSVADVTARLAKGRFRVKANVDRATANVYVSDLGKIGAKVVIEAAGPADTATPPSGLRAATTPPPSRTATPPSGLRTVTSPPPTKGATNPPFASGLAAALERPAAQDLGVLGGEGGSFALASVDGQGDDSVAAAPHSSFAPPPVAAAPAPRPSAPKVGAAPHQQDMPDMFAPPDAEEAEQKMDLAVDESPREQRRRMSTPPAGAPPVVAPPVSTPVLQRKRSASSAPPHQRTTALPSRGRLGPLSDVRNRFAAGVIVAILVGFVPTHVIATFREHDAYAKIDSRYLVEAGDAPDVKTWSSLDEPALREKKSAQREIAMTSLLLWALFGAAAGYVWFRRIPWSRLDAG